MVGSRRRAPKVVGLAVGLFAAIALVVGWRVPGGTGVAGLDVTVVAIPTGEVGLTPPGPVFHANDLLPGSPGHTGAFDIENRTGRSLAVRVRAVPSVDGLEALRLEIRSGADRIFGGSLGQLRTWTSRDIHLASGATAPLSVRVWVAASASSPQGGEETVTLTFDAVPEVGG
jgi:hypothetical protein